MNEQKILKELEETKFLLAERMKELEFLYELDEITKIPDITLEDRAKKIVSNIPPAWQHSDIAGGYLLVDNKEYKTHLFDKNSEWIQRADIEVMGEKTGVILVSYTEKRKNEPSGEGPFLKEERLLINTLAERIGSLIANTKLSVELEESKRRESIIKQQTTDILELATPVIQVMDGILTAPLIGTLDSERTQQFMEVLLARVVETNAHIALVDITGVPVIDTQTAQHLVDTIMAVKLVGAHVIVTGVRPAIAQTLVHLGINLSDVITKASLAEGIKVALKMLGMKIVNDSLK